MNTTTLNTLFNICQDAQDPKDTKDSEDLNKDLNGNGGDLSQYNPSFISERLGTALGINKDLETAIHALQRKGNYDPFLGLLEGLDLSETEYFPGLKTTRVETNLSNKIVQETLTNYLQAHSKKLLDMVVFVKDVNDNLLQANSVAFKVNSLIPVLMSDGGYQIEAFIDVGCTMPSYPMCDHYEIIGVFHQVGEMVKDEIKTKMVLDFQMIFSESLYGEAENGHGYMMPRCAVCYHKYLTEALKIRNLV